MTPAPLEGFQARSSEIKKLIYAYHWLELPVLIASYPYPQRWGSWSSSKQTSGQNLRRVATLVSTKVRDEYPSGSPGRSWVMRRVIWLMTAPGQPENIRSSRHWWFEERRRLYVRLSAKLKWELEGYRDRTTHQVCLFVVRNRLQYHRLCSTMSSWKL